MQWFLKPIFPFDFFPDADLYETLTEDFLIDQIAKVMGSIDSQLVSDVMEICSIPGVNRNENNKSADGVETVSKSNKLNWRYELT